MTTLTEAKKKGASLPFANVSVFTDIPIKLNSLIQLNGIRQSILLHCYYP